MTFAVLAIFVLSGAAGLIYEVVWARQLVLVFGNTTQAVSAILTGFFGGMAIGSALGGRFADRVRRPLRMYGLLEIVLVVVVLLTPITFRLLHEVYRGIFEALETAPLALGLVRFVLALVALGPATVLMGATLPALTRYLTRDAHLSRAFGRLYAANTLGGILGTFAAGFLLIELFGLTGALVVGVICSGTAGVIAVVLDRGASPGADVAVETPPAVQAGPAAGHDLPRVPRVWLALGVAFVSGLTSLSYQVLWTRLLASGSGNSTYVFSMILGLFLVGLFIGAIAFAVLRTRIRNTLLVLAATNGLVALLVLVGMVTEIARPGESIGTIAFSPEALRDRLLGPFALVVLPATIVMGFSFPAASALLASDRGRIASGAGLLLAANTSGAISGTFLVPFFLVPLVGSPSALGLVALASAATGVVLAISSRARSGELAIPAVAAAAMVVVLLAGLVNRGVFVDPNTVRLDRANAEILESAEDEIASVQAATSTNGFRSLWVTGSSMTLLTVDAKLMPVLPLVARPDARTNLTIAFGMGSAYRTALIAGLDVEGVELVPSVPDMFGSFYSDAAAVLADPRGRLVIADGRNHLELTPKQFDMIIVDPPPPIESAGASVISNWEFYRAGHARLTPGGVMMQWVPFGQTLDELKAHVRTFADVFRHVTIAFGPGGYGTYMLGSDDPIELTAERVQDVLARPGLVEDLGSAFDSPARSADEWAALVPGLTWATDDKVRAFAGSGPLVTDDRPLPEYFLLRRLFGERSPYASRELLVSLAPGP